MPSSAPSQRQLRVGELVRHELASVFSRGETGDPTLERLGVTGLEVAVSPDLRVATAYVRPFTGDRARSFSPPSTAIANTFAASSRRVCA